MDTKTLIILSILFIVSIGGTWIVQDWRWEAKQNKAVTAAISAHTAEEDKAAAAATLLETTKEKTNVTYKNIDDAINATAATPGVISAGCLDPVGLHIINSALSRKSATPSGLAGAVPQPITTP